MACKLAREVHVCLYIDYIRTKKRNKKKVSQPTLSAYTGVFRNKVANMWSRGLWTSQSTLITNNQHGPATDQHTKHSRKTPQQTYSAATVLSHTSSTRSSVTVMCPRTRQVKSSGDVIKHSMSTMNFQVKVCTVNRMNLMDNRLEALLAIRLGITTIKATILPDMHLLA